MYNCTREARGSEPGAEQALGDGGAGGQRRSELGQGPPAHRVPRRPAAIAISLTSALDARTLAVMTRARVPPPRLDVLETFWHSTGQAAPPVTVVNGDDVLPSVLDTTGLALGAVSAAASAAGELVEARGAPRPACLVDGQRVSAAFRSNEFLRLNGEPVRGFAPLSGFWPTRDGWVRTHANYPHHRARLLDAVGLAGDAGAEDLAMALARIAATEAEARVLTAGGLCVAVRHRAQWRSHPHSPAVDALPLVGWTRLGDAPRRRLAPAPETPLRPAAGLKVLDLTRVIAGPVATRTLALLGAEVLRVDPPSLPEIAWQHLDTGMGKRSTLLDLGQPRDRGRFDALLEEADVLVAGYRPDALAHLGLDPTSVAERRPGLVVATLSAWGPSGPWGGFRGFDSIVQAATGIAEAESVDGVRPGRLPAQALDHATGYLLAAAVLRAVTVQLRAGGTYRVEAHLARGAHWLLEHHVGRRGELPSAESVLRERESPAGILRYVAPALRVGDSPEDWDTVGGPWGADPPTWSPGPGPRAGR